MDCSSRSTAPSVASRGARHQREPNMSDFLLELSKNPQARRFIDSLGLPISLPEELRRARGPWNERPLEGATVVVYSSTSGELLPLIANTVIPAGARVVLAG